MSTEGYDSTQNNSHNNANQNAGNANQGNSNQQQFQSTTDEFKQGYNNMVNSQENKKVMAGLLGIFLGGLGIHKFVLGYNNEGFILLGILVVSIPLMCVLIGFFTIYIPAIIGLIEGIIYLTKSDEEFYQTYQVGRKPWF